METIRVILADVIMAAAFMFVIWYGGKWLGKRIERSYFNEQYKWLKFVIENSPVCPDAYMLIVKQFNELEENKQKDVVKLVRLRNDFNTKFKVYAKDKPGKPISFDTVISN